jgi:hypothetical protein
MEGQTSPFGPVAGTPVRGHDPDTPSYAPAEPGGLLASLPGALTFVAGIWLLLAPSVIDYGAGSAADENDVGVGAAVALLALVRAVAPRSVPVLSGVSLVLGAWLVVAPFLLAYESSDATVNDIVVGLVIIVLSAISVGVAIRTQRAHYFARRAREVADRPA